MSKEFISKIAVMLKKEYDPLGDHLVKKTHELGFSGIKSIRTGKLFEVKQSLECPDAAKENAFNMTGTLLANNNIEDATEIVVLDTGQKPLLKLNNPEIMYEG